MIAGFRLAIHKLSNALAEEVDDFGLDEAARWQRVADDGGEIMGGKQNVVLEELYL